MKLLKGVLGKLLEGASVLLGLAIITFVILLWLPTDPARQTLGLRADVASAQQVRAQWGLDQPKSVQMGLWLNDLSPLSFYTPQRLEALHFPRLKLFKLGSYVMVLKLPYLRESYTSGRPVTSILGGALPATLVLALSSFGIALIGGLILGTIAGVYRGTPQASMAVLSSLVGVSLPSFFGAIVIAYFFGYKWGDFTGLPLYGSWIDTDPLTGPHFSVRNLILPAFALGIRPLAIITLLTRSAMLDVLRAPYLLTARAKGLAPRVWIVKHALRNALNPVLTGATGWLASLMAGAFFIEFIFGWHGLGLVTVDALMNADLPLLMGAVLYVGAIFVVINLLTDLGYRLLDPRART